MAITKIWNIPKSKNGNMSSSLYRSLVYIVNPEKTKGGVLVGGINCIPDVGLAYEQMCATKKIFGKELGRQGYHIVLSCPKEEGNPEDMYEMTKEFIQRFLGDRYEALFAVHTDKGHLHSHIVYNSCNMIDGYKYQYSKGDWKNILQPITNELCEKYGLSIMPAEYSKELQKVSRKEYEFVKSIKDSILNDVDYCMSKAENMDEFLWNLEQLGYEVKRGKHIAVRITGMSKFRRLDTLSEALTPENIEITLESMKDKDVTYNNYTNDNYKYMTSWRSDFQKKFYIKIVRLRQIETHRFVSKSAKRYADLKRFHELQAQYIYLTKNNIKSSEELMDRRAAIIDKLETKSNKQQEIYGYNRRLKNDSKHNIENIEANNAKLSDNKQLLETIKTEKKELYKQLELVDSIIAESLYESLLRVTFKDMDQDVADATRPVIPESPWKKEKREEAEEAIRVAEINRRREVERLAEQKRQEAIRKQQEEMKKLEEQRQRDEAEKLAELKRQEEVKMKQEARKQQEEARKKAERERIEKIRQKQLEEERTKSNAYHKWQSKISTNIVSALDLTYGMPYVEEYTDMLTELLNIKKDDKPLEFFMLPIEDYYSFSNRMKEEADREAKHVAEQSEKKKEEVLQRAMEEAENLKKQEFDLKADDMKQIFENAGYNKDTIMYGDEAIMATLVFDEEMGRSEFVDIFMEMLDKMQVRAKYTDMLEKAYAVYRAKDVVEEVINDNAKAMDSDNVAHEAEPATEDDKLLNDMGKQYEESQDIFVEEHETDYKKEDREKVIAEIKNTPATFEEFLKLPPRKQAEILFENKTDTRNIVKLLQEYADSCGYSFEYSGELFDVANSIKEVADSVLLEKEVVPLVKELRLAGVNADNFCKLNPESIASLFAYIGDDYNHMFKVMSEVMRQLGVNADYDDMMDFVVKISGANERNSMRSNSVIRRI